MKIACYCQHVLGIGHFHRSLEICRKLAETHVVTMIVGGAPLPLEEENISFMQLPGMVMDTQFNNLAPYDKSKRLEDVKTARIEQLHRFFATFSPQVFLTELYPFGRKGFRFELDPLLAAIKKGTFGKCLTLCSLRDILVERHDQGKFEQRIITTLNSSYDGLLIHGDKSFMPLDISFSRVNDIAIPYKYTGYVTPQIEQKRRSTIRHHLDIADNDRLIVASIGSGSVGSELLRRVVQAFNRINDDSFILRIFTGPYAPGSLYEELGAKTNGRIVIKGFTSRFSHWLAAADLSISMAGYNTTMNTLAAGTPALFYPFRQNQEQWLRISALAKQVPFVILDEANLAPDRLADLMTAAIDKKRFRSPVSLNGASTTAKLVEQWFAAKP